jgi:hypothetical protein
LRSSDGSIKNSKSRCANENKLETIEPHDKIVELVVFVELVEVVILVGLVVFVELFDWLILVK